MNVEQEARQREDWREKKWFIDVFESPKIVDDSFYFELENSGKTKEKLRKSLER